MNYKKFNDIEQAFNEAITRAVHGEMMAVYMKEEGEYFAGPFAGWRRTPEGSKVLEIYDPNDIVFQWWVERNTYHPDGEKYIATEDMVAHERERYWTL